MWPYPSAAISRLSRRHPWIWQTPRHNMLRTVNGCRVAAALRVACSASQPPPSQLWQRMQATRVYNAPTQVVTYGNQSQSGGRSQVAVLGIVRVFKTVRLLRLLRVVRLYRYIQRWETMIVINSSSLRMMKLFVVLVLFSHWKCAADGRHCGAPSSTPAPPTRPRPPKRPTIPSKNALSLDPHAPSRAPKPPLTIT